MIKDWLIRIAVLLGAGVLFELVAFALRPLRPLFRSPHGWGTLAAVWLIAGSAFAAALRLGRAVPAAGIALALVSPFVAGIALLTFRDERQAARGVPVAGVGGTLGPVVRVIAGILALLAGLATPLMIWGLGWSEWRSWLGPAVLAAIFGYAAYTGRAPGRLGAAVTSTPTRHLSQAQDPPPG